MTTAADSGALLAQPHVATERHEAFNATRNRTRTFIDARSMCVSAHDPFKGARRGAETAFG